MLENDLVERNGTLFRPCERYRRDHIVLPFYSANPSNPETGCPGTITHSTSHVAYDWASKYLAPGNYFVRAVNRQPSSRAKDS